MIQLENIIKLAGAAQLALVAVSFFIPRVLNWDSDLSKLPRLLRQMFWTYAVYLLGSHLFFGLLSTFAASELTRGSVLACFLTGFMLIWWAARLVLQFFCFDMSEVQQSLFHKMAKWGLSALFICLTVVYGCAFFRNILLCA
ncbi:hypothetical protein [Rubritalea sp.]|uniref:hypothetical protein n=1 Tax=Rubritalea sp. TaxID=2109375 RepID=UPI003EF23603